MQVVRFLNKDMITKYEIDYLNVEDADAILIHFVDDVLGEKVIAIDAGRYSDGELVSNFVKKYYGRRFIDIAICTHCDDDHYGGFIKLIEEQLDYPYTGIKILSLLINDPGKYIKASDVKYYKSDANAKEEARTVYTLSDGEKNLLDIAKEARIPMRDAFSSGGDDYSLFNGAIEILAPTMWHYEELAPILRHNLEPYDTDDNQEDDTTLEYGRCISPKLDAAPDDTSTHNQSSVILLFNPGDGNKFVFTGDAGRQAFDCMLDIDREKMKEALVLKIPHHGSQHNIDSTMINFINPKMAIVSAKSSKKYFNPMVKHALKRKGVMVYSTMSNGSLRYNSGFDARDDYTLAAPM